MVVVITCNRLETQYGVFYKIICKINQVSRGCHASYLGRDSTYSVVSSVGYVHVSLGICSHVLGNRITFVNRAEEHR